MYQISNRQLSVPNIKEGAVSSGVNTPLVTSYHWPNLHLQFPHKTSVGNLALQILRRQDEENTNAIPKQLVLEPLALPHAAITLNTDG